MDNDEKREVEKWIGKKPQSEEKWKREEGSVVRKTS